MSAFLASEGHLVHIEKVVLLPAFSFPRLEVYQRRRVALAGFGELHRHVVADSVEFYIETQGF